MRLKRSRARHGSVVGLSLVALAAAWLLVGGSGSTPRSTPAVASRASSLHIAQPVGVTPSEAARMVCAPEAQKEIASVLGAPTAVVLPPTWFEDVYSCRYVYADGTMILSVKELSNQAETNAYFASLRAQLGRHEPVKGLGQGAFVTKNGSVVVRKDYKVLLVDTSGLPAQFGSWSKHRAQTAIDVGVTVLGCWTGA